MRMFLLLGFLMVPAMVGQAGAENVLRWASAGGVLTWDPHGTTETPSLVDSALHFRELYHSRAGRWGAAGYANPALDQLIDQIAGALVTYARDALIEEAWRMILDDVVVIPLHRQMIVWAMRDDLDLPVSPLNSPTFSRATLH